MNLFERWLMVLPFLWTTVNAQVVMSGRAWTTRHAGSPDRLPLSTILCLATLEGAGHESKAFRTWETEPAGWFRISGGAGNYTLAFTQPAFFMRPVVWNNIFTRPGDKLEAFEVKPRLDFANFYEREWDPKPARDYYQTFVARGRGLTHVGFRLASDGVDGAGPLKQNLVVSLHRQGPGTPDTWPQVGPAVRVPEVDSGGPKNYIWCAGWNSGEVPLRPGETYAVHLTAETPGNTFQAFWRTNGEPGADCYRVGAANTGFQSHQLWLAVGTDGDGLLIPYNKRVQKQFGVFAGFAQKWSQTYMAQGRALAAVVLYAAVGGTQPPLSRQRVFVRVRRGGPDGPVMGVEKVAIGNGNYTGDASWGVFGAAFAPGEVPLTPGDTYALEFDSLENEETLRGFVNKKGQESDSRPGFNPYRKHPLDQYEQGAAYQQGTNAMDFDLDLQVLEYEFAAAHYRLATTGTNLLTNGTFEQAAERAEPERAAVASSAGTEGIKPTLGSAGYLQFPQLQAGLPAAWKTFALDPQTRHSRMAETREGRNHLGRVYAEGGQTADGGYVQRVAGLTRLETYRLSGRLRSSWAADAEHQCHIGLDPTGQEENPQATTIVWTTGPDLHGVFVPYLSDPVRPAANAISVWLRGKSTAPGDRFAPFKADFDDFALRQVRTGVPEGPEEGR